MSLEMQQGLDSLSFLDHGQDIRGFSTQATRPAFCFGEITLTEAGRTGLGSDGRSRHRTPRWEATASVQGQADGAGPGGAGGDGAGGRGSLVLVVPTEPAGGPGAEGQGKAGVRGSGCLHKCISKPIIMLLL